MLTEPILNQKIVGNIYASSMMVLNVEKTVQTCWDETIMVIY